jgi:hypothetical protein
MRGKKCTPYDSANDPDLIFLPEAEELTGSSHQTIYRLIKKKKLSKPVMVRVKDSIGKWHWLPKFRKSELESLFVKWPEKPRIGESPEPVRTLSGELPLGIRMHLRENARRYSGLSDIVLTSHRLGKKMDPPATHQLYVVSTRGRGRPKLLTAWTEKYLDKVNDGQVQDHPERGQGAWARAQRAKARNQVTEFLRAVKKDLPIRAMEGLMRARNAGLSMFLLHDEMRVDKSIETVVWGRNGRASEYWWIRPGQRPADRLQRTAARVTSIADVGSVPLETAGRAPLPESNESKQPTAHAPPKVFSRDSFFYVPERRKRMGTPPKPQTTELLLFCSQERAKGETLSAILDAAHVIFQERAPQTEAEISIYAKRWNDMPQEEKTYRLEQLKMWKNAQKNGG